MKPFIKWVGGKSRMLSEIRARLPEDYNRIIEPFVGGGAFMFNQTCPAMINDFNWQLASTYRAVKDNPEDVIRGLSAMEVSKDKYLEIRSQEPTEQTEVAVRLIYLNKVGFNGMWRENKSGKFNVPYGKKDGKTIEQLVSFEQIALASSRLQNVDVFSGDFEVVTKYAKPDDFVFFDPPYIDTWDGYAKDGDSFTRDDQLRLRRVLDELNAKGTKFILTNSYNETTVELYKGFSQEEAQVSYTVGGKNASRAKRSEIIVRNY